MKRALDIAFSLVGLVLGAPLLAVAAIAIHRESTGPAFFAQTRVGRNERPFTLYKLRTMYVGTSDVATHQVEASAVTPLGARLRRWKLDELPQLYNVLVGDMSLVGPRPCLPSQVELVAARRRLGVFATRPGVTGLAQVQGVDMSEPQRLASIDAEYVRTRSLLGDIHLLIATALGQGVGVDRIDPNRKRDL
jgi:O-antigen biosynthesis protein WbqP